MLKTRYYVNPSSLGSYFGVGFLNPDEQILIDMGVNEAVFDDDSIDRMDLGRFLEDGALNYFENKLGITITERNDMLLELYDGKIHGKVDGVTILNGKKTVVENKISNAQSYKFTDNIGYMFQVQAYMIDNAYEQCLLCGLYQGKPIYKIVEPNPEMIEDIKRMVDFIVDVEMGMVDFDVEYPTDLLEKYSTTRKLEKLENVPDDVVNYWVELGSLQAQKAKIESDIKGLAMKYPNVLDVISSLEDGKFENDFIKVSYSTVRRSGGIDTDSLSLDYQNIDFSKYRKPDTIYNTTKIKVK